MLIYCGVPALKWDLPVLDMMQTAKNNPCKLMQSTAFPRELNEKLQLRSIASELVPFCCGLVISNENFPVFLLTSSVPESVKELTLSNRSTEDLQVTWLKAEGDVDKYEIQLLFNDMKIFPPIFLGNTIEEYWFTALTPGRLYKILVLTISGDVQRATFIEGLTSKK